MFAIAGKWVLGKVVSFGLGKALMWAAGAVASAVVVWMWNDYQDAKARVVNLRTQVEALATANRDAMERGLIREAQLRSDLATARATSQRRADEAASLQADIDKIREIKRPDHEKACPVHPAIGFALGRLRGGPANPTSR
jgi:uncharacterized protein HemX